MKSVHILMIIGLLLSFNMSKGKGEISFHTIENLIVSIKLNRGDILFPEKYKKYIESFEYLKDIQGKRQAIFVVKSRYVYTLLEKYSEHYIYRTRQSEGIR